MDLGAGSSHYHNGRDCYKYTEKLLRNSRELFIVSPYIDEYYAHFLKKVGKGKRIKIISSSIEKRAEKILSKRKPLGLLLSFLIVVVGSDYLINLFGLLSNAEIAVSAGLVLISMLLFMRIKYDISIKKPKDFVHAKMYISDHSAIHGSANLTYNGMHTNVEHIEIVENKENIEKLKDEFFKMWKSL